MKYLSEIELTNIVYFKHARFKFTRGLTFIQGRNLQRVGPQASNGSGKSLLFGVLPNLIHDAHPTITKNGRSVQKTLYGKGSKASVSYKTDVKSKYDYLYTKTGSKVSLSKNGKDIASRIARDQIKAHLDFSEEEFFSTVYLDSRRENKFQMGTSAERYAYITSLFRLHNLDDFRKHVNKQISTLKGDESVLSQTALDLEDARKRLKEIPPEVVEQADAESQWLERATHKVQTLQALVHQTETYAKFVQAEAALDKCERPAKKLSVIRDALQELDRYEAKLEQWTELATKRKKLKAEIATLPITDDDLDEMTRQRDGLEPVDKPSRPEINRDAAAKYAKKDLQVYLDRRAEGRAAKTAAQNLLAKFDREVGDSDECPTCHSSLSQATKKAVRASIRGDIELAEAAIAKASAVIEGINASQEWVTYDRRKAEYLAFKESEKFIQGYDFKEALRFRRLKQQLEQPLPSKPEPVDHDRELLEPMIEAWAKYNTLKDKANALRCDPPDGEVEEGQIEKLQSQISKRMSGLSALQAIAADRKSLIRTVKELKARHEELTVKLDDLPVYKMLTEAYSTTGLKTLMVQRVAMALETNLNRYAKTIFSEDFNFTFDVQDGHFNVFVHRKADGKVTSSDIRMMSGAESRMFIFLFVLALLPLMPSSRRMNVMILDEPDANMDVETREIFRDSLLPRLAKVVPSLIVISPNSDIVPQHARVFTVVKSGGESKLYKGTYAATVPLVTAALAGAKSSGRGKRASTRSTAKS